MPIRVNYDGTYDVVDANDHVIASKLTLSTAQEIENNRRPSELDTMTGRAAGGCGYWLVTWFSQPLFRSYPWLLTRLALILWPGAIALYIYNAQSAHPANIYLILTAMILMFIFPSPLVKRIARIILYIALALAIIYAIIIFIVH